MGMLLELRDVRVSFTLKRSTLFGSSSVLKAVDGVSRAARKGQTRGGVGQAGSATTTLALAVARLVEVSGGQIALNGIDLLGLSGEALRKVRHSMQFIFQDPYSSMNPRTTAGEIIRSPLKIMNIGNEQ